MEELLSFWKHCRDRRLEQLRMHEKSLDLVRFEGGDVHATQRAFVQEAGKKYAHANNMIEIIEREINNAQY